VFTSQDFATSASLEYGFNAVSVSFFVFGVATWTRLLGDLRASAATATRIIDKIKYDCEPLLTFPFAGPTRENFAPGLRVSFSGNYAVYYVNNDRELVIVRVLHGARDAAAIAEHGGFAIPDDASGDA